jgi:hypothetical protein
MAPAMNKLWSTLRSRLAPNEQPDKSGERELPSARPTAATATATADSQRDPPHELPELHFSPPLEAPELPRSADPAAQKGQRREEEAPPSTKTTTTTRDPQALPPPLPQIETLRVTDYATSVTPPTPVEASSSSHPGSTFSASRPSTPPSSEPSQSTGQASTGTPLSAFSSPNLTPHDLRGANALAHRERRHHRRSSSTGSRSFRETLNAYSTEDADGRRSVNQYILGETLGRGSYATVEKAVDRETGEEYVSPASCEAVMLDRAADRELLSLGHQGVFKAAPAPDRGGGSAPSRTVVPHPECKVARTRSRAWPRTRWGYDKGVPCPRGSGGWRRSRAGQSGPRP